jgi:alpha-glucosidase
MQTPYEASETGRGIELYNGETTIRLEFATSGIVRVQKFAGQDAPTKHLIRYEFFRNEWPAVALDVEHKDGQVILRSELLTVSADLGDGKLGISDATGGELLREAEPAVAGPQPGFSTRFHLPEQRRFFGLGDQNRDRIEHRGQTADLWIRNVTCYLPIPFLVTNDGFGLLVNTTRRTSVDLGATDDSWFSFAADGDSLDYYFIYGPSPKQVIGRYADVTGKPFMPPKWALGLFFICRTQADARELMDDCYTFRREGIPCDAVSLEPGWMEQNYDFSLDKKWHSDRFPIALWSDRSKSAFLHAIHRMGYKFGLWLCSNYDFTHEEERRLGRTMEARGEQQAHSENDLFDDEKLQERARLDKLTRPEEPWFDHLKKLVDQGTDFFKQDAASTVFPPPDRLYGNDLTDADMHNLNPLLYARQMYEGFREHTGRRPFVFYCLGWAGVQAHAATWAGDTGGEQNSAMASLNLSMTGHGMTGSDMHVFTREGLHFGFLQPWAQINSFFCWYHPWYLGDEMKPIFIYYDRLRHRLIPYLYSSAWEAHTTGTPFLRAMPLEFPEDPATYDLHRQYMLGPSLLVGIFTDRVYLPAGDWYDFWSDERICGGQWYEADIPDDRGGPLLVRAGAVIPMTKDMDYVGQEPDDELTLHVYPGPASVLELYEDDGISHEFEQGARRLTRITQENAGNETVIEIGAAEGTFDGAVTVRRIRVVVHCVPAPSAIEMNGNSLSASEIGPAPSWHWDGTTRALTIELANCDVSEPIALKISC